MLEQPAWEIKRTIYTRAEEDFNTSLGLPPEGRNLQQMLKRGVVVVDKVPGPSSHEVVAWVRKLMELDHVGHGGTLDPKVTGVTEWCHYTDFARKFILEGRRRREGWPRALRDGVLKEEAAYLIERAWKQRVEEKIAATLRPTGLIPQAPHGMNEIIGEGRHEFVDPELESEATVSPAGVVPRFKRFTVTGIFRVGADIDASLAYINLDDSAVLLLEFAGGAQRPFSQFADWAGRPAARSRMHVELMGNGDIVMAVILRCAARAAGAGRARRRPTPCPWDR